MSSINPTSGPGNEEYQESAYHEFHALDVNTSGVVYLGEDEVNLYTHFGRAVSLDRFEEILEDLLEWTKQRKAERGLQDVEPLSQVQTNE